MRKENKLHLNILRIIIKSVYNEDNLFLVMECKWMLDAAEKLMGYSWTAKMRQNKKTQCVKRAKNVIIVQVYLRILLSDQQNN